MDKPKRRLTTWPGLGRVLLALGVCWGGGVLACAGGSVEPASDIQIGTTDVGTVSDTEGPDVTPEPDRYALPPWTATVARTASQSGEIRYRLTSDAPLRDGAPAGGVRTVASRDSGPRLTSGDPLLDALFAMAVEEAGQLSVAQITDGAFNDGQGVDCDCFETGADWNYVWTRDIAYAVDLGLVWVDTARAARSLEFKLSPLKGQALATREIVQDTGSGGSWPVSTDRVVWALGGARVLAHLSSVPVNDVPANDLTEPSAAGFSETIRVALMNTATRDRDYVFDTVDGLYRGETSFLDWREQTYLPETAGDTALIAQGKAASTNLAHLALLRLSSRLSAAAGDAQTAALHGGWAEALAGRIRARFWEPDAAALWSTVGGPLDPGPVAQRDLLALSLASALGVLSGSEVAEALSAYPRSPTGTPVVWPQQVGVPIYHNRAQWPFVSAYALFAAINADHGASADHDLQSLVRGAALNLSHMENFEWRDQLAWSDSGAQSGPVVNSQRQLWSVAGYLGAWIRGVFGVSADLEAAGVLQVRPYLPAAFARRWKLAPGGTIELSGLSWGQGALDISMILPDGSETSGAFVATAATLDGAPVSVATANGRGALRVSSLGPGPHVLIIQLGHRESALETLKVIGSSDPEDTYQAPASPRIISISDPALGSVELTFDRAPVPGTHYRVFRDGALSADRVRAGIWRDDGTTGPPSELAAACYAIEARRDVGEITSLRSSARCAWGPGGERVTDIDAWSFAATGGQWTQENGRGYYAGWGAPADTLTVHGVRPQFSGKYLLQPQYSNGSGGFTTGITCGHKWLRVVRVSDGSEIGAGSVVMPQNDAWGAWSGGTFLEAELSADETYRIQLSDAQNMSYFSHFSAYTGGLGGGDEAFNNINISAIRLLSLTGPMRQPVPPAIAPRGDDDLGKYGAERVNPTGVPMNSWSAWAWDADAENLYLTVVSAAFEDGFTPVIIYLAPYREGDIGAAGPVTAPTPGAGISYRGLTPTLPFTPTFAITMRGQSDAGDGAGPWSGLWHQHEGAWVQRQRFKAGVEVWRASDKHTITAKIPRAMLDGQSSFWLAGHAVHGEAGSEWKEAMPPGHTPWTSDGGAYLTIDLDAR